MVYTCTSLLSAGGPIIRGSYTLSVLNIRPSVTPEPANEGETAVTAHCK